MGIRARTNVDALSFDWVAADRVQAIRRTTAVAQRTTVANALLELTNGLLSGDDLRTDVRSLQQDQQDGNDGVSALQTVLGSLDRTSSLLGRLRDLAAQTASGTLSAADHATAGQELESLLGEVDSLSSSTAFAGVNLLDGSAGALVLRAGSGTGQGGDSIEVPLPNTSADELGIAALDLRAGGNAGAAIESAIGKVTADRATLGTLQDRLVRGLRTLAARTEGAVPEASLIRDAAAAEAAATATGERIVGQRPQAVLAQANVQPQRSLALLLPR